MFCFGNTTCQGNQQKFKKYSCEKSDRKDENRSKEDDSNRSDTEDGDGTNKKYEIPNGCTTHFPRDSGCQHLDVTGIKPGDYFLRFIVNPAMLTAEEKFDNNVVTCKIKLDRNGNDKLKVKNERENDGKLQLKVERCKTKTLKLRDKEIAVK